MRAMLSIVLLIFLKDMALADYFDIADVELTTVVKPKTKDCFYQHAGKGQILRMEFQVIDAGISAKDLTISITVRSPSNLIVLKAVKKTSKIHRLKISETGDYEICLDNTFSVLSSKTVYFEISAEMNTDFQLDLLNDMKDNESNDTISKLRRTAKKVKKNLETVKHYQDTYRAVEARDINIQEKNLVKVNTISSLTMVFMMLLGSFQLFVLKSMFNPNSLLYKFFKIVC